MTSKYASMRAEVGPVRWEAIVVCLAFAGCATRIARTTLRADLVGTKYARQTGYFAACGVDCREETTPGRIQHDTIRDEATLITTGPQETCVAVVVRTESGLDEPFDQLAPTCAIDGPDQRAVVEDEVVSVFDYNYTGQVETVLAEGVAANTFLGFSLTQPQEMIFRVVQRSGKLCCPKATGRSVKLSMRNPHLDVGVSEAQLNFEWELQR
jgi:hypothetical protein